VDLGQGPVQTAEMNGLRNVPGGDVFGALEVSNGASDFEDARLSAGEEGKFGDGPFQGRFGVNSTRYIRLF